MSFQTLGSANIATGSPVTNDLWQKTKGNFDNHETRIATLETSIQVYPPIKFTVRNGGGITGAVTGVLYERLFKAVTITDARLFVIDAGTSGTYDIDVQKKTGAGSFSSIFSTRPTVAFGAGSYALSTNQVIAVTSLAVGDILRLDINSVQVGNLEFHVYLAF